MTKSNARAQQLREKKSLIDSFIAYQGPVIQLQIDTYDIEGKEKKTEIIHHPGAVVIVPIGPENQLFLVQQWRRAIQQITFELPAGTLEKNEDPLTCAQRELQEEIGYMAKKITPLKGFYPAPGFCDEYLHLFIGEDLVSSQLSPDDDEGIDIIEITQNEVVHWIQEGKIKDAKSIAGILLYTLWKS